MSAHHARQRLDLGRTRRAAALADVLVLLAVEQHEEEALADRQRMPGHHPAHGHTPTEAAEAANVILLNPCAIREHAEARALGRLGELARHKRRRPDVRLGVTGCMAQHLRERLAERAPWVDV